MSLPYATRLAAHLAESRRHLVPFESAWVAAMADHPRPKNVNGSDGEWFVHTLEFAKRAFRDGYLNLGERSSMGVLAFGEAAIHKDAPDRQERPHICGWGGGCDEPARDGGYLCEHHADLIHAIADSAPLPDWNSVTGNPPQCVEPGCLVFAQRNNLRCGSHDLAMAA